jgi:hypothetical protein
MYHVELRQFPHNFCRFNLTRAELDEEILDAWAQGEWLEFGERKWNPHQANLTVLDGPRIPIDQLSMGRGWRNAQRHCEDVTERLLDEARGAAGASSSVGADGKPGSGVGWAAERRSGTGWGVGSGVAASVRAEPDLRLAADSLGLELLAQLASAPGPLASAWRLSRARYPERPASDCLRLAELAVQSLVDAGLIVVLTANDSGGHEQCNSPEQLEHALRAIDSWSRTEGAAAAQMRRA